MILRAGFPKHRVAGRDLKEDHSGCWGMAGAEAGDMDSSSGDRDIIKQETYMK